VYLGETRSSGSLKERPDTDKEKRYIEGRYGAIPVFENFQNIHYPKYRSTICNILHWFEYFHKTLAKWKSLLKKRTLPKTY